MLEIIDIPTEVRSNEAATFAPHDAQRSLAVAQSYIIDDDEMFEAAGDELRTIVTKARKIDEMRKSITTPMLEAKKRVDDFFRVPLDMLKQAEDALKLGMGGYQRQQQAKIDAARREQEAAAERQRQEQTRIDAERRAAEAAAQAERDRLTADAEKKVQEAIATGNTAAMAAAEQAMAQAAAVQVEPAQQQPQELFAQAATTAVIPLAPRAAGVSSRTQWRARVTDKSAFIRAAAGRPEIEALLDVNEGALNKFAAATGGNALIAGISFYEDTVIAARRR